MLTIFKENNDRCCHPMFVRQGKEASANVAAFSGEG